MMQSTPASFAAGVMFKNDVVHERGRCQHNYKVEIMIGLLRELGLR